MQTKLPWYIMPYYPFFALTVGAYLSYLWQEKYNYSRILVGLFSLLTIFTLGGCIYFLITRHPLILIGMAVILIGTIGLTTWQLWNGDRRFIPTLFIGLYLSLALLMLSPSWLWELNEQYPVLEVATIAKEYTPEKTTIYTSFPDYRPSLDFYSDRQVLPKSREELQQLGKEGNYLLLDRQTFTSFQLSESAILGTAENFVLIRDRRTSIFPEFPKLKKISPPNLPEF